ncbi:hypothetical protein HQ584_00415 [Patescibacteria group bacterium]|nr:hypothetical protein [Patescibacteria group bacterium]
MAENSLFHQGNSSKKKLKEGIQIVKSLQRQPANWRIIILAVNIAVYVSLALLEVLKLQWIFAVPAIVSLISYLIALIVLARYKKSYIRLLAKGHAKVIEDHRYGKDDLELSRSDVAIMNLIVSATNELSIQKE